MNNLNAFFTLTQVFLSAMVNGTKKKIKKSFNLFFVMIQDEKKMFVIGEPIF